MQDQQTQQAPQGLIQKGGMHGQGGIVSVALEPLHDHRAGHPPGKIGIAAECLLIKKVPPPADALTDQKAQGGQVEHGQRVHLAQPAHP